MAASLGLNPSRTLELNDRWKNEFFPQCDNPSLEPNNSYKFGEMVGKIDQILCEGKKTCLFVGRPSSQVLPPNNQEEEWISADHQMVSSTGGESIPGRIHLWINCNQQDAIESLRGLFDKIVVDWSTIGALSDDFAKRFSVMLRSPESTLIFEPSTSFQYRTYAAERTFSTQSYSIFYPVDDENEDADRREEFLSNYYESTSADQQQLDWEEYVENHGGRSLMARGFSKEELEPNFMEFITEKAGMETFSSQCAKWGRELLKSHLETLFEHVELHEKEPFPYPNGYNGIGYFLVSHPRM